MFLTIKSASSPIKNAQAAMKYEALNKKWTTAGSPFSCTTSAQKAF
jgi:hypothetical protein